MMGGEEAVAGRPKYPLLDIILGLSMLVWMSVAVSLGSMGFVINGMVKSLAINDRTVESLLGSSSLIGMLIGALTSGFIGDIVIFMVKMDSMLKWVLR
jgi:hypothetical protein